MDQIFYSADSRFYFYLSWSLSPSFCRSLHQRRVLKTWLAAQSRGGSSQTDDTQAWLEELCATEGLSPEGGSEGEEDEEEMENSELIEDSDIQFSDSG